MAIFIKSTNLVKTQIFHPRKKNIEGVYISHCSLDELNNSKNPRSFRLYRQIRPNIDVINGEKINGVSIGETSYIGLKKSEVINDNEEDLVHGYMQGKFVEGRFVYKQTFIIRSYEIGPDQTATMETLMNLLQVC